MQSLALVKQAQVLDWILQSQAHPQVFQASPQAPVVEPYVYSGELQEAAHSVTY